jgi:hypothetical protein
LTAARLIDVVGPVKAAELVREHSEREIPSARSVGLQLRRKAVLAEWDVHRWHHPRFLARLAASYGVGERQIRRWLGSRYWTKRRASYCRRVGASVDAAAARDGARVGQPATVAIARLR